MVSVKRKVIIGFVLLVITYSIAALVIFKTTQSPLPSIQGVVLASPVSLDAFKIITHHNTYFSNSDLLGKWHIVSYGYTNCPDICPTTLKVLVGVKRELRKRQSFNNVDILFYSIDPQRDTVEHLAEYMPYFDENFIGLTSTEKSKSDAIAFEKSLGLKSILTPLEDNRINEFTGSYSVSHGVMLYIVNPSGELQAVLRPDSNVNGIQHFSAAKIVEDFLLILTHFS